MTAAVSAIPVLPLQLPDSTAEARKRRREILVSQRNTSAEPAPKPVQAPVVEVPTKRRKLDEGDETTATMKPAKKPQMKYDPDVPMTKEEAAAWRREQRRKRNRESAAASRQRQRDRITELEEEVDDWKIKVQAIMDKIKALEDATGLKAPEMEPVVQTEALKLMVVSPPPSPGHSPMHSPIAAPVPSSSYIVPVPVTPKEEYGAQTEGRTEQELSDKMVS